MATLYIDSDGTVTGTHVLVLGDEGELLGELEGVRHVQWDISAMDGRRKGMAGLLVQDVPGRFLVNEVLIEQLKPRRRPWWRRLFGPPLVATQNPRPKP